jgi:predicted alpha/beta-hydrolase family hydrolase
MTSQAQAREPLPGVRGLVFFGFPLHAPGRPGVERAEHLSAVEIPMLFLQGTRDEFASLDLLQGVVRRLGSRATLHLIDEGDHSFKVPKRTGKTERDVFDELATTIQQWADSNG